MNLKEIKDAARQAFRDQQSQDTEGGVPDGISFIAGFLAGARHLQNAYETLNAHDEMLIATVDKLKEDNTKLVEALKIGVEAGEFFARHADCKRDSWSCKCSFCKDTNSSSNLRKARQVLKEVGEE